MRFEQCLLHVENTVGYRIGARENRVHHWEPRTLLPESAEVVVRCRVLEHALERGIADQKLRVRLLPERHVHGVRQQDADEHDRGRALRRDGNRPDSGKRRTRDELDRVDRPLRGNCNAGEDAKPVGVARVRDRRDRGQIDLAREQPAVQLRRNARDLLGVRVEAEEERRHVDVRDAPEADHGASSAG